MVKREVSIFEIIGPIMVGPSSSHTAGAVRIGKMARLILGQQPQQARIELHGSFADTGEGHGTNRALIAGLLDMPPDADDIRNSFAVAKLAGLDFSFEAVDLGDDAHPNTARLTVSAGELRTQITAASVGGGQIEVLNVNGYDLRFGGDYDTLLILAEDRPGTINAVTGWLAKQEINVAYLRVERNQRGGDAMMIIETDQPLNDDLIEAIEDFHWVRWARSVPKLGE